MKQSCFILTFHLVLTVQYAAPETYRQWYDNTVRNCTPGSTIKYYTPNKNCTCIQPGVIDSCHFLGVRDDSAIRLREPGRTAGKEWKPKQPCFTLAAPVFDGCNWCGCDGGRFTCTKNPCVKKLKGLHIDSIIVGPGGTINMNKSGPEKCPSKSYYDGCNWCSCSNGWTMCTLKNCDPEKKQEVNKCINNPEGGYMSDDGCNWCTCMPDNNAICSRRGCIKESKDVKKKKSIKDMCVNNKERGFLSEDECNWCICTPDNSDAICTRRGCTKDAKEKKKSIKAKCKNNPKGGYWHDDGCNWCACTRDRSNAICTKGACKDNKKEKNEDLFPEEDKKEPKKTPDTCKGKFWGRALMSDGCNTCTCLFGKSILCTVMYCPEPVVTLSKKSQNVCSGRNWGRVLMSDGCNTCSCVYGNMVACTIMLCPEPVATLTKKLSSGVCKTGMRRVKLDQCNVCLCDDNGVAKCTMKYCLGENTGSDKKKDKKTLQGLKYNVPRHRMKLYALKEKAQSCKVGEKFKQPYATCNWCTCVEDGVVTCDTEACPGDFNGFD